MCQFGCFAVLYEYVVSPVDFAVLKSILHIDWFDLSAYCLGSYVRPIDLFRASGSSCNAVVGG